MSKTIKLLLFPLWFVWQMAKLFDYFVIGGIKIVIKDFMEFVNK